MDKEKTRSNKKFIVSIVILGILLLGAIGFIVYDKVLVKNNVAEETESEAKKTNQKVTEEIKDQDESLLPIKFDSSKCENNKDVTYTLAVYDNADGLSAKLNTDKKSLTLMINWKFFGPLSNSSTWSESVETYTVGGFNNEVEDIYIGGYGQTGGTQTILYLMNDGTVEYTPITKALTAKTSADGNNLKSFGKLDGVEKIVKFYTADKTGGVTTLAMKSDGNFYDLGTILQSTGNY